MRYLFGFICVIMLAVAGCGEETIPCKERTDCGELVQVYGYYVLADDRCTAVWCKNGQVCLFQSLDCQGRGMTNFGCLGVEFTECNPNVENVCGNLWPINEGVGCPLSNCTNEICRDGSCACEGWCICDGKIRPRLALASWGGRRPKDEGGNSRAGRIGLDRSLSACEVNEMGLVRRASRAGVVLQAHVGGAARVTQPRNTPSGCR
jgi:hypothetical protein